MMHFTVANVAISAAFIVLAFLVRKLMIEDPPALSIDSRRIRSVDREHSMPVTNSGSLDTRLDENKKKSRVID